MNPLWYAFRSKYFILRCLSSNFCPGIWILSWPGFIKTLAYKPKTPAIDNAMIIIPIKLKFRFADIRSGWKPFSGCHLKRPSLRSKFLTQNLTWQGVRRKYYQPVTECDPWTPGCKWVLLMVVRFSRGFRWFNFEQGNSIFTGVHLFYY